MRVRSIQILSATLALCLGLSAPVSAATRNAADQRYSNNADGFTLGGGTTVRSLTVSGGDLILTGNGGSNTYNFPTPLAGNATTLVGIDEIQTLTNKTLTGNVGINTAVPLANLEVVKTAGTAPLKISSSAGGAGNYVIVSSSGNVGIGESSPSVKLDVNGGGIKATGSIYSSGSYVQGGTALMQTSGGFAAFGSNAAATGVRINTNADGTGTAGMTVINGGNVGIGTTAPNAILEVSSSGANSYLRLSSSFAQSGGSSGVDIYGVDASGNIKQAAAFNTYAEDYNAASYRVGIDLKVNNRNTVTTALRITGDGNVGIATTIPNATLEIQKSGTTPPLMVSSSGSTDGDYLIVTSSGNLGVGTISPITKVEIKKDVNDAVAALVINQEQGTGAIADFRFGGSSKASVGYDGTISSAALRANFGLAVNGGYGIKENVDVNRGQIYVGSATAGNLIYRNINDAYSALTVNNFQGVGKIADFQFGGTSKAVVDYAGNVGINTTAPQEKLEVDGAIYVGKTTAPSTTTDRLYNVGGALTWNGAEVSTGGASGWTSDSSTKTTTTYNVGIGTTTPAATLDVSSGYYSAGTAPTLRIGADVGAATRTDATRKLGSITQIPYTVSNAPYLLIGGDADLTYNRVSIGGSFAGYNAATLISFYTSAAGVNATGGTERVRIDSAGNIGLATTTPNATLEIQKSGTRPPFMVSSSGATDGDYVVVTSSGNVGIGTAAPLSPLSVVGANQTLSGVVSTTQVSLTTNDVQAADVGAAIGLGGYADTAKTLLRNFAVIAGRKESSEDNVTSGYLSLLTHLSGTGLVERMRINSSGNVGIGSVAPTQLLDVNGASKLSGVYVGLASSTAVSSGSSGGILTLMGGATSQGGRIDVVGGNGVVSDTGTILFYSGVGAAPAWGEHMRLDAAGNLGINTTRPQEKLEVDGAVYLGRMTAPSTTTDRLYNVGGTLTWNGSAVGTGSIASGTAGYFSYYPSTGTSLDDQMLLYTDGTNIGIGTVAPTSKLEILGSTNTFIARSGLVDADGVGVNVKNLGTYISGSNTTADQVGIQLSSVGASNDTAIVSLGVRSVEGGDKYGYITATYGTIPTPLYLNAIGSYVSVPSSNLGVGTTTPQATFEIQKVSTRAPLMVSSSGSTDGDYLIVTSSGNVGIGSANPSIPLTVRRPSQGEILRLDATGYPYMSYHIGATRKGWAGFGFGDVDFEVSNESTGNIVFRTHGNTVRMLISYGGNIGINTTVPQEKLEVDGAVYLGRMTAPSTTTDRLYNVDGTLTWNGSAVSAGSGWTSDSSTKTTTTYNVGIGTTTPALLLHVGNTGATSAAHKMLVESGLAVLNSSGRKGAALYSGTTYGAVYSYDWGSNSALPLALQIMGGNVGVGSTAPTDVLDVNGKIAMGTTAGYVEGIGNGITLKRQGSTQKGFAQDFAGSYFGQFFWGVGIYVHSANVNPIGETYNVPAGDLWVDGNIGVATITPSAALEIQKSGTTPPLMVSSSGSTDGDYVVVASNGNVGIGSASPAAKFHVSGGTARFDGPVDIGNTSGATGYLAGNVYVGGAIGLFIATGNTTNGGIKFVTKAGGAWHDGTMTLTSSNVGINTTAPQEKFEVDGAIYVGRITAPSTTTDRLYNVAGTLTWNGTAVGVGSVNSGTAGYFSYYPSTGTTVDDQTILYTDGTNIGIGSTSPTAALQVIGDLTLGKQNSGTGREIIFNTQGSGSNKITFYEATLDFFQILHDGSPANPGNLLKIRSASGASGIDTDVMTFKQSGNVGIATTTPNATLEIQKSGTTSPLMVSSAGSTDGDYLIVTSEGNVGIGTITASSKLTLRNGDFSMYGSYTLQNANSNLILQSASNDIIFSAGGVKARLTSAGNLGINTTAPQEKLEVDGAVYLGRMTAPSTTTDRLYNVGGTLTWNGSAVGTGSIASGTAGYFGYYPSTGTSIDDQTVLYTDGTNVGIGSSSPGSVLDVVGNLRVKRSANMFTTVLSGSSTATTYNGDGWVLSLANTNTTSNNYVPLWFSDDHTTAVAMIAAQITDHTNKYGNLQFITKGTGSSGIRVMIDERGNVGVSTTLPNATLEVQKSGTTPPLMVSSSGSTDGDYVIVTSSGNVGIGTMSPHEKLEVFGNPSAGTTVGDFVVDTTARTVYVGRLSSTPGDNTNLIFRNRLGVTKFRVDPAASGTHLWDPEAADIQLQPTGSGGVAIGASSAGTAKLYVNGNVGVATTTPSATLEIQKSGTTPPLMVSSSGSTDGDYVIVASSGNVGVGTTTTSGAKLHVLDSIKMLSANSAFPSSYIQYGTGNGWESYLMNNHASGWYAGLTQNFYYTADNVYTYTGTNGAWKGAAAVLFQHNATILFQTNADGTVTPPATRMIINNVGNIGINTTAPQEKLEVDGAIYVGKMTAPSTTTDRLYNVAGTLTWNGAALATGGPSGWTSDSSTKTTTTYNVGIGTTVPVQKLEVAGNVRIAPGADATTMLQIIRFATAANDFSVGNQQMTLGSGKTNLYWNGGAALAIQPSASHSTGVLIAANSSDQADATKTIFRVTDNTYNTPWLNIVGGGNVGIGTTSPGAKFEIIGSTANKKLQLGDNPVNATATYFTDLSAAGSGINFSRASDGVYNSTIFSYSTAGNLINLAIMGRHDVVIGSGNLTPSEIARFTSTGNVGIATITPNATLEIQKSGTTPPLMVSSSGSTDGDYLIVASSGNVGVGTASPIAKLYVYGGGNDMAAFGTSSAAGWVSFRNLSAGVRGYMGFGSTGSLFTGALTDSMAIRAESALHLGANGNNLIMTLSSGNVGVATTTPNATLEIQKSGTTPPLMVSSSGSTDGDYVIVTSFGNVGIGSTNPASKVSISGSDSSGPVMVSIANLSNSSSASSRYMLLNDRNDTTKNQAYFGVYSSGSGQSIFGISAPDWAALATYGTNNSGLALGTINNKPIVFGQNNVEVMRVTSGNVGINTTAPQEKLEVDGAIYVGRMTAPSTTTDRLYNVAGTLTWNGATLGTGSGTVNSGTSGYFSYYPSTGTTVDDQALLYTDGTSIGIGTTAPSFKLDVWSAATAWATRIYNSHVSAGYGLLVRAGNDATNKIAEFRDGSDSAKVTILGNGNVGIGTTSPQLSLHLKTSSHLAYFDSTYNTGNAGAAIFLRNTATGGASSGNARSISFGFNDTTDTSLNTAQIRAVTESAAGAGSVPTALQFFTGFNSSASVRMSIASTGNVGIATITPNATLEIQKSGTTPPLMVSSSGWVDGDYMMVTSAGNVGIGTTVPQDKLNITGSATPDGSVLLWISNIAAGTTASPNYMGILFGGYGNYQKAKIVAQEKSANTHFSDLLFYTNSGSTPGNLQEKMRITGDGNVGIGTINPVAKLVVSNSGSGFEFSPGASGATSYLSTYNRAGSSYGAMSLDSSQLLWRASGVEKVRIDSNGNVGIATSSPGVKLEVQDSLSNVPTIKVGTTPGVEVLQGSVLGQVAFSVFDDSTTAVREDAGYIKAIAEGCGSGAPCRWDGDSNNDIAGLGLYSLSSRQTTNEVVRITGTGNVGIGTTVPAKKLEVKNGDVYINNTSSKLIMKKPDGTCSACGPDNSDVWTCAATACP